MMIDQIDEVVLPIESEELVALESGWYMDYSSPPYVNRKWIEAGTKFRVTPQNAEVLLQNFLVLRAGQRLPKVPEQLNCSMAAYLCAEKSGISLKDVIGTGPGGKIVVRDVNRTTFEAYENSPQFLAMRG